MTRRPLNALLLEDSEDDALLVLRELGQQGFAVESERAWTAPAMKSLLEARTWDVVLSDYCMPNFDAPAALRLLRETGEDLPFIVVSGTIGEEAAVAAMKNGAHDYLMKGNLARLGAAIEREIRDAEVRRDHRRAVDKIQHMNRVLRAIRNVNQLIVTEKDRERLLQRAVQILVETRGYTSALCVHLDDNQQPDIVAHSLASGIDTGPSREAIRTDGLTACMEQALATNEVVVLESDAPECSGCPLTSRYPDMRRLTRGLVHGGKAYGVLGIVLPEGVSLDTEELDLLEEMAGNIAFALQGIESERLHKESLERFRIITESSPDAIFIADRTGNYTYVNSAASGILGYSADELTRMTIADVSAKEQLENAWQVFQKLLAEGHVYSEIDLKRKDGSVVSVDLNAVILPDGQIYGSCRDLTERKLAEDQLRRERDFNETLIRTAQAIVLVLDPEGRVVLFNPYLEELSGYKLEDLRGEEWFTTFLPEPRREATRKLFRSALEGSPTRGSIDVLLARDGRELSIEWNHRVLTDGQGQTIGLLCTGQDVTARQETEDLLRESQEYLSSIIDAIADPVFVKDNDFRFVLGNRALCRLLGTTKHELLGTTGAEFLPAKEMDHFLSVDREVLSSGMENISKEPLSAQDGTIRTLVTKKTRFVDHRNAKFIVGVIRDITEFEQMQAQVAQSDRLATMGMLAAGVAHEINNPLTYVLYNLESLTDDLPKLSSALRKCLDIIADRIGNEEWAQLMGKEQELLNPAMLDDIRARFEDGLEGAHRIRDVARGLGTFSRVERDRLVPVALMHVIEVAINMAFNEIKYRASP